jgi:hypothetical protein
VQAGADCDPGEAQGQALGAQNGSAGLLAFVIVGFTDTIGKALPSSDLTVKCRRGDVGKPYRCCFHCGKCHSTKILMSRYLHPIRQRWHMLCLLSGEMKLYLVGALAAVALTLNAEAVPKEKDKDEPSVIIVDKVKDKDKGPVYSVPDSGSTVLLLGTAVLALGVASRRFATR